MGWLIAIILLAIFAPRVLGFLGALFGVLLLPFIVFFGLWLLIAMALMELGEISGLGAAGLGLILAIWAMSWVIEWAKKRWPSA